MNGKKDLLEMDYSEISVVQAVGLTVGAASVCWENMDDTGEFDSDRAKALVDKLEERIQIEVEKGCQHKDPNEVDPDEPSYVPVDEHDEVTKVMFEDEVEFVVINGVVFKKMCNRTVAESPTGQTFCIKQWGHESPIHEDQFGSESR